MTYLQANWNAPTNVKAVTTTRIEGFSQPPYDKNNLGLHVGDNAGHVQANRERLITSLQLPREPEWLDQTHSTDCIIVEQDNNRQADAAITRSNQHVLAIMTADCLPIVLSNRQGSEVAAIHAGWRGLANGIIEKTLNKMNSQPQDLIAWVGPAICQSCYQTGAEVYDYFLTHYPFVADCFFPDESKWRANLSLIAEKVLIHQKVAQITQSNICTFEQKNEFYSYRRASQTGRMATLVWFI
ncbi:Laccase domain protein YfiH [Legionella birminghamensis]|uniref:Purine nucleoside phosphorylase n=1 Tax=Legionella birminghamensis TaxID=28083 RepID=A0A378I992_9GAMM|nr:peptidoglycan editing factor PgeF [Legionella birminghamensis]KTC67895.1 Laccase domain protein YfiH [Legionella birminghamensis]STX31396.1 Laccase domain protein yfiH [Legionella birminghamensis]